MTSTPNHEAKHTSVNTERSSEKVAAPIQASSTDAGKRHPVEGFRTKALLGSGGPSHPAIRRSQR